jgi:hypothetical protein
MNLMGDNLAATVAALKQKNVGVLILMERCGNRTTIPLPSGSSIGLYQPTHPAALTLSARL